MRALSLDMIPLNTECNHSFFTVSDNCTHILHRGQSVSATINAKFKKECYNADALLSNVLTRNTEIRTKHNSKSSSWFWLNLHVDLEISFEVGHVQMIIMMRITCRVDQIVLCTRSRWTVWSWNKKSIDVFANDFQWFQRLQPISNYKLTGKPSNHFENSWLTSIEQKKVLIHIRRHVDTSSRFGTAIRIRTSNQSKNRKNREIWSAGCDYRMGNLRSRFSKKKDSGATTLIWSAVPLQSQFNYYLIASPSKLA